MADHILWPDHPVPDEALGGKAAALRRLGEAGLPVPDWFVISAEAWNDHRDKGELSRDAWIEAARRLVSGGLLAVRSSARDEDGSGHSFAGQLDSFLAVSPEEIPEKALAVWQSAYGERARAYRAERGLGEPVPPAVLVQRLLSPDAAGVAFSSDPVSGRRGVAVVSAVVGLGTRLVDGQGEADLWRVDRRGRIIAFVPASKPLAHRPRPGGVATEAVDRPDAPALTSDQASTVAALARRCAALAGAPQDIEWAFEDGRLHLLQSRPITTLRGLPDPDGRPALWDNSNIAESYGGVTTPLTYTFARRAYEEVYRQFCRILGVPESRIADNADTFRGMIGFIRGRVYYNLLHWYRVLALLPGYAVNRGFMEQMMGVREGLPEELRPQVSPAGFWARRLDALALLRSILGLWAAHLTLGRRIGSFNARLNQALAEPEFPYAAFRPDELAAAYRDLERKLLTRWDAPLVNDFLAMIFFGTLRKLCVSWLDDADGTLANDLVAAQGGVVSVEPALRVRALADAVRSDPDLVRLCREGTLPQIRRVLASRPAFAAGIDDYLERFGDRCLEELKLESPTLEDDPLPLFRAIGNQAARTASEPSGAMGERRTAAERRALRRLSIWRRVVFGRVLANARARLRDRENLRFERTRLFGRVRRLFAELGRRLHGAGRLERPDDVFFLEVEEVLGFVEGTGAGTDLRGLARVRREADAAFRSAPPPPDRFLTRGWAGESPLETAVPEAHRPAETGGDMRRGTGCCPGRVSGPARVVLDPRGVDLPAGSILVAERTDPGWIMLFPAAAGLVVERGSLLSHSAIVARELGLPAVVGVPGCTSWIRDGEWIELDGTTGEVRKADHDRD